QGDARSRSVLAGRSARRRSPAATVQPALAARELTRRFAGEHAPCERPGKPLAGPPFPARPAGQGRAGSFFENNPTPHPFPEAERGGGWGRLPVFLSFTHSPRLLELIALAD